LAFISITDNLVRVFPLSTIAITKQIYDSKNTYDFFLEKIFLIEKPKKK
jgi:hypothetical protein